MVRRKCPSRQRGTRPDQFKFRSPFLTEVVRRAVYTSLIRRAVSRDTFATCFGTSLGSEPPQSAAVIIAAWLNKSLIFTQPYHRFRWVDLGCFLAETSGVGLDPIVLWLLVPLITVICGLIQPIDYYGSYEFWSSTHVLSFPIDYATFGFYGLYWTVLILSFFM